MRLVPEIVKLSLLSIGGIQPFLATVAEACGGTLCDPPSAEEIQYYKKKQSKLQFIMVVLNTTFIGLNDNEQPLALVYSISLVPATKRQQVVSSNDIVTWTNLLSSGYMSKPTAYTGMSPFNGEWSMFGQAESILKSSEGQGSFDEVGLVYDYFLLNTEFDSADVCATNFDFSDNTFFRRYLKRRTNLLFKPFNTYRSRRIWGVESKIELVLLQEFALRQLYPTPQVIILETGHTAPSLYNLWQDQILQSDAGVITEADFYFEKSRVAVFCDGAGHRRKKQVERDKKIDSSLSELGIKSIRIEGRNIAKNVSFECDRIVSEL